jgi:hypothetical protein
MAVRLSFLFLFFEPELQEEIPDTIRIAMKIGINGVLINKIQQAGGKDTNFNNACPGIVREENRNASRVTRYDLAMERENNSLV